MAEFERITCADVEVGDFIGRTRTERFARVTQIDEGPVSRRLHQRYEPEDVHPDRKAWYATHYGDPDLALNAGNIRPRREAKLWRRVAA